MQVWHYYYWIVTWKGTFSPTCNIIGAESAHFHNIIFCILGGNLFQFIVCFNIFIPSYSLFLLWWLILQFTYTSLLLPISDTWHRNVCDINLSWKFCKEPAYILYPYIAPNLLNCLGTNDCEYEAWMIQTNKTKLLLPVYGQAVIINILKKSIF